jgi:uncharacterized membrane protein YhaH (DUF805 family)
MMEPISWAVTPLRRYADFSGRSTRTELAYFYLFTMLLGIALSMCALLVFGPRGESWAKLACLLLLTCPWIALGARRLHDTGRSGWWVLLVAPAAAVNLWDGWRGFDDPFALPRLEMSLPALVSLPLVFCLLAFWVLLLWKDEEGANQYGPNPRYETAEAGA